MASQGNVDDDSHLYSEEWSRRHSSKGQTTSMVGGVNTDSGGVGDKLLAEKSMFQARAQAEMKLKEVELDTKIAKTAAKEKVYSEADAAGQGQGLETQRQMSHAMFLPKPEVPKFTGDPTEFSAFFMAFDARIAPHTSSEADRLYYLDQQLQGEPKDLISGCLHMDPLAGYAAARNLLCKEYGDPYRISTAYMNKIRTWPNLKNEDNNGGDRVVQTYAMLDNGSTGCFITEGLKDELQAKSTPTLLRLQTMNGTGLINTTVVSDIVISDLSDRQFVSLPRTFCKDVMPVGHDNIPKSDALMQLPGLKNVAEMMPLYRPDLNIGLLIGSNCSDGLRPLEVTPSSGNGPFAVKYKLGWTVNGPLQVKCNLEDKSVVCNMVDLKEHEKVSECITPDTVLKLFELDFNEADVGKVPGERGYSIEDQRFIKETEEKLRVMPLKFLQTRLLANLDASGICHTMECIIRKKLNKIRVVFDCSAKYGGLSINDVLLQGPDLANSLIGVLARFRTDQVAFMGDVEAMFHQVKVPREHQDYLRFLWWPDGNVHSELKEYRMTVHTFGTVSSPTVANYALKSTGAKSRSNYDDQVAQTIERNFYVDDCLKSVESDECASDLIKNVKLACADGGFNLTKFTSSSKMVLSSIPQEHRSKEIQAVDLSRDDIPMERALGLQWDTKLDCFKYTVDLPEKPFTRRGILSMVSSLYDPLGLVAPVLLPAKRILQDLCKDKDLGWDDNIGMEFAGRWTNWLQEVEMLKGLTVRRCVKPPDFGDVLSQLLHIFSDASSTGYGCSAYIRLFDINGNIHTTLLLGKARLAPLKTLTIPRLELTAATVSVKIGQFLLRELDVNIDRVTYYTDSTTVLQYIRSEKNRFPVFVANRVKLIRDFSTPEQWKYVDSKTNPADIASRGSSCSQFLKSIEWFNGPKFLRMPDSKSISEPQKTIEAAVMSTLNETADSPGDVVSKLLNYYSSWYRLKRAVAIYRRFFNFLKSKSQKGKPSANALLSLQELIDSEKSILSFVQHMEYGSEIAILSKNTEMGYRPTVLPRSSPVRNLCPCFVDGLLRVGGRLSNANISDTMKHPVLLPRKSPLSDLIVRDVHERLGHAGRNHVLSALREEFWITNANSAVRSILNKCVLCRRLKMSTGQQIMSDLPTNRVQPSPPFTCTGLDCFGPHTVREGRKEVKRYGVLFTCMVSRAVHIETANSFNTDSFINALKRFIARRGAVKEISCDNGTNFTSGAKELCHALDEIDQSEVHNYLLKLNIIWKFNPPSASHMGGVWERLIRSVRGVLSPLLQEYSQRLDDELYRTLLCEVESILNSRPLTTMSSDPSDVEPLTPNHLLMKSDPDPDPDSWELFGYYED
ncbi:uncharacterized protein LOC124261551 [Haliotis rubra]|uniref:uncharacterized protein LOC124261551 n=1 Tax=Haliotis rubra TaxID=36100 RepID=UPI001EE5A455|nr:uncharacterized protein LOC124261551 [Haliotis rubra]